MKIQNIQNLDTGTASQIRSQETGTAKNASTFKFRLDGGKITSDEITHMLTLARVSTKYKNNAANYQFKLKSDSNGQYLTLKQQGTWSNFKGFFGIGHKAREQERAQAKNLINQALKLSELPDKTYNDPKFDNRFSKSDAKEYQLSMMNTSAISPVVKHDLVMMGLSKAETKAQNLEKKQQHDSENVTMSMLANEQPYVSAEPVAGNPSYQAYDPEEESKLLQVASQQEPGYAAPAHNSYMRNTEANHLSNADDASDYDRDSEVEVNEKNREDFNQFMYGLILKQAHAKE